MGQQALQKVSMDALCSLVRRAGMAILSVYGREFAVEAKADDSPLTAADRAAHQILVEGLKTLSPLPVLSEEGRLIPFEARRRWTRYWLLDPLDGTKEFVKRNGEFTVNIALVEQGRPVLGVVYAPALDRLYYAASGDGAYRQDAGDEPVRLRVRPRRVGEPWQVVASRSHMGEAVARFVDCLGAHRLVSMGSSLKLCLIAEGRAHLYPRLGPTSEWDTAAAQCVVEAAGGQVVDPSGQPLRYNTKGSVLNPFFIACTDVSEEWTGCL